jgi:hypothetical protein
MRLLLAPALAATLLGSVVTSPLRADLKSFEDCVAFTIRWCKAAREDASFFEEMAVDFQCTLMVLGCSAELVSGPSEPAK